MSLKKTRSFGESVEFYQHRAIQSDLKNLLEGGRDDESLETLSSSMCPTVASSSWDSEVDRMFRHSMAFPKLYSHSANTVCQVQFKHSRRNYMLPDSLLHVGLGEYVVVQSFVDKSLEDLGVITALYTSEHFSKLRAAKGLSDDPEENKVGKVIRVATFEEKKMLPLKCEKEYPLLNACQYFAAQMKLELSIYDVEYQFDGRVIYIYYTSVERVDYREFARHITRLCAQKTRIQMKKISESMTSFVPDAYGGNTFITTAVSPSSYASM